MHRSQVQNFILLIILCFSARFLPSSTAYRILGIFPHPGITHFYFFHPIMRGLADAGHDVTVLSQFPDPNPPKNYKDLLITGVPSLHNTVELKVQKKKKTLIQRFLLKYMYICTFNYRCLKNLYRYHIFWNFLCSTHGA